MPEVLRTKMINLATACKAIITCLQNIILRDWDRWAELYEGGAECEGGDTVSWHHSTSRSWHKTQCWRGQPQPSPVSHHHQLFHWEQKLWKFQEQNNVVRTWIKSILDSDESAD